MTRSQFMFELMSALDGMPDEDKYNITNDYEKYFDEQLENGVEESEIINALGSPGLIAKRYISGDPIPLDGIMPQKGKSRKTAGSIAKFILLLPVGAVTVPLTAVVCVVLALIAAAVCIVSLAGGVFSFTLLSFSPGFIIIGLGLIALTFAFVMLCIALSKFTALAVGAFPRFMKKVLENEVDDK